MFLKNDSIFAKGVRDFGSEMPLSAIERNVRMKISRYCSCFRYKTRFIRSNIVGRDDQGS